MRLSLLPYLALLLLFVCIRQTQAKRNKTTDGGRDGKLLSVFQIIRFPNDHCSGSSSQNGTCYTEQECENRDGTPQGSCASGYGVCCVFALNCGGSSSENCTYFESTGNEVGDCVLEICKCDTNICQLRLDFNTFTITGPATDVAKAGQFNGVDIVRETQCLTDKFSVSNPGGITPPAICGVNTGEHMYVDASDCCNNLVFQLGAVGVGATPVTRQWNIKVTQYSCDYENLAPDGCTQYFFSGSTGTIQTFNHQGGHHLASQNQNICIRQERGLCRICYTVTADIDFSTSAMTAAMGLAKQTSCCGYGADAKQSKFDCANIPGAVKDTANDMQVHSNLCGNRLVTKTGPDAGGTKTVCSFRVPFEVRFISDNFEFVTEAPLDQVGFMLQYTMDAMRCP